MRLLRVVRAEWAADGIRLLELRDPGAGTLPAFTAGAHVQVRAPNGALRKYSLCNDPLAGEGYVVAVKRDACGHGGSVSLADDTRVGALLEVSQPRNAFELDAAAPGYLLIAGGIGITPILSMARYLLREGRRFRLYYLARTPEETAFLDELSREPFRPHVVIHHDHGDPRCSFDLWPLFEKPARDHVYCCGPRPLLETVRDMTGHWPPHAIHFESFVDAAAGARRDDAPFDVVLARSGDRIVVPPGVSILESLRAAGHEAPSSCESGTCGTCKTRLISGRADHRDLVLMDDEREDHIMICVSRAAAGAELVIDA